MDNKLQVIDVENLLAAPIPPTYFVVQDLIPQGISVLCGDSKIGKSWLMLWLGLQVSRGQKLWNFSTNQCDVLYLALEDTYRRLRDRLYYLTENSTQPKNFKLAVMSDKIGCGLEEQIKDYLADYPKTKLIIIDTLQKIRDSKGSSGKSGIYSNDYDDISAIKRIADDYGIAIVLVHHLRKLKDSDNPFNQISGSNGIMGAADTAYLLKKNYSTGESSLIANGRDVGQFELVLSFENRIWKLLEQKSREDIEQEAVPEFLFRVVDYLNIHKSWTGTASELLAELGDTETSPNVVTKMLSKFYYDFLCERGIEYKTKRTNKSRYIALQKCDDRDDGDGINDTVTVVTPVTETENKKEKNNE